MSTTGEAGGIGSHAELKETPRRSRIFGFFAFALSVAYGLWLAGLPLLEFKDRANYLRYAHASGSIADRYLADGWRAVLFNEPAWLAVNDLLSRVFVSEEVLWLIIFVPASTVAWLILSRGPQHFLYLIFLMIVPFVIKNHIIHLRQGLAIAVFFLALRVKSTPGRICLLALAPLIHSSFFVILLIYVLSRLIRRMSTRPALSIAFLMVASFIGTAAFSSVAMWSGARQAGTIESQMGDITGLGLMLWLVVLLIFFSEGAAFVRTNLFPIAVLLFYACSYFFTEQAGRILESGVLAVFFAALGLSRGRYRLFALALVGYTVISYITRMGSPWWGWGL